MSKYNCELNLGDRNSLSVILSRIQPNSKILEFGPANGRMTKYMKEQLNCKVYAVEIDANAAKDASQYTEKIVIDSIENYTWKNEFHGLQFDYIIFADVLEHLYYPEKVLESVKDFLNKNGSILVSIPNIAHNSIIINLFNNRFDYSPTGLLDDTHIRFFTKETFDQLIKKIGYFTSYESAIFLNPENTEFRNSYQDIPIEISNYLSKLQHGEIYQLIYQFSKNPSELISDLLNEYKVSYKNFIQLFISEDTDFTEEKSIKYPISEIIEFQKFEFNLESFKNIKNLRLDPLNDSCVIDIEKLYLRIKADEEIDLIPHIISNTCSQHDKSYFFDFFDPQIYFENIDLQIHDITKLCIELRYDSISKDAVYSCINQVRNNKDYLIRIQEQNIQRLNEELNKRNDECNSLTNKLRLKEVIC